MQFVMTNEAGEVLASSLGSAAPLLKALAKPQDAAMAAEKPEDEGEPKDEPQAAAKPDDADPAADPAAEPAGDGKALDNNADNLPPAVSDAVDSLGGGQWEHDEGCSRHPLRFGGDNHANALDALKDAGWSHAHSGEESDVLTHKDGHTAVIDRSGLTIAHAGAKVPDRDAKPEAPPEPMNKALAALESMAAMYR